MNLANIGTLNRASFMAYSVKEGKCPMLFLQEGKNGKQNPTEPFKGAGS